MTFFYKILGWDVDTLFDDDKILLDGCWSFNIPIIIQNAAVLIFMGCDSLSNITATAMLYQKILI